MYSDIPTGVNRDYYLSGRSRALYFLSGPLAGNPPPGTPSWWSNEGNKDAWDGLPSRVGEESVLTGPDGQPMPVKIGIADPQTGQIPQSPYGTAAPQTGAPPPAANPPAGIPAGTWPAPNPGVVKLPSWVDDYWSGYLWALQDPGTAIQRLREGNRWTPDYQRGLADGLAPRPPKDPRGFVPTSAQLAQVPFPILRQAPVYTQRPPLPPPTSPPPLALVTKEIFGMLRGRRVPVWDILRPDGLLSHVIRGGRIVIGAHPGEGFGLGGSPGAWPQASGGASPSAFGLDPQVGVVAFDGTSARPIDAHTLEKMLGSGWRQLLQYAT